MNKEELVQEVAKKAKVTQKEAVEVLNSFIETVAKKLHWLALVLLKLAKELQEQAATLKQAKKLKLLQKQFLHSQPAKNSKNLLTKNSFLEFFENNIKRHGFHAAFIFVIATI